MLTKLRLKIPGKVIINGSYIVLRGETGTSVTIDRFLDVDASLSPSQDCSIIVNIKDRERLTCSYTDKLVCDSTNTKTFFIFKIIETFYKLTGIGPRNHLVILMSFDRDFFINESIKTGIGSSACIVVGIIYSLLCFNENEFIKNIEKIKFVDSPSFDNSIIDYFSQHLNIRLEIANCLVNFMYTVTKTLSPMSSGMDVMSCLLGNIKFSSSLIEKISKIGKFLVLGTFGKCTCTRSIINQLNMQDEKWEKIVKLNKDVLNNPSKRTYECYLDGLFELNNFTVPERQYKVLKDSFAFDIYSCGISGAGGEDAVWCIVEDYTEIVGFWKNTFDHVIVTLIVENGLTVVNKDVIVYFFRYCCSIDLIW